MDIFFTPVVATAVIILLTFVYIWIKNRGVLPGPIGVPYLGLYPCLTDENAHLILEEYKKKYGDLFSFTYTGRLYINMGSIKAMREVLLNKSDCFMDRFEGTNILTAFLSKSVTFVNGEQWKVLRKFFILKFKEYGLNTIRVNIAGTVYDSLETTIEDLKNADGKPVNIVELLGKRSTVTIRRILFGEKGITDENVERIVALYTEMLEGNFSVNMLLIGPLARKFFILKFKEYGLNTIRDNIAGTVYDSLETTIEDLKNADGKPVNIVELLAKRSTVTIRRILFGEKGITDENVERIVALYIEMLEGNFSVNMLLIGPLARLLFAIKPSFRKNLNSYKNATKIIHECAQNMERSMNEDNPTCIIEEFYKERNKRRRENDSTWNYLSDEALVESIMQFVGDGIQSVVAFVDGLLNVLLEYPDEQDKLYSEIADMVGPNRQPSAEDKPKLPYTNAFINEYIRQTNFVPFFPSLECTKETTIRGYRIPKGSIALYNFRSAHTDPETFEEPEVFNPSRYIPSSDIPKAESPVSFGMGKRSCAGEQFIMMQIFLFLTTIVKNFKIVTSNASAENSEEVPIAGQLTFVPRTEN